MIDNIKPFNEQEKALELYNDYAELINKTTSWFLPGKGMKLSTSK